MFDPVGVFAYKSADITISTRFLHGVND